MFKVGDKVTITSVEFHNSDIKGYPFLIAFAPIMRTLLNETGTITAVKEYQHLTTVCDVKIDDPTLYYLDTYLWPEYCLTLLEEEITVSVPGLGEITLKPRKETTCSK